MLGNEGNPINRIRRRTPEQIREGVINALSASISDAHKIFCHNYVIDFNATRSYKAMKPGTTSESASTEGSKLIRKPAIRKYIALLVKRLTEENFLEADMVMKEIATLAFSNILDYVKWTESSLTLQPSRKLTRDMGSCIKEVRRLESKGGEVNIQFKMYDKYKGLQMLAQYFALLKPEMDEEDVNLRARNLRDALDSMFSSVPLLPPGQEIIDVNKEEDGKEEVNGG